MPGAISHETQEAFGFAEDLKDHFCHIDVLLFAICRDMEEPVIDEVIVRESIGDLQDALQCIRVICHIQPIALVLSLRVNRHRFIGECSANDGWDEFLLCLVGPKLFVQRDTAILSL